MIDQLTGDSQEEHERRPEQDPQYVTKAAQVSTLVRQMVASLPSLPSVMNQANNAVLRIFSYKPKRWPWAADSQCARCGDFPGLAAEDEPEGAATALGDMGICNTGCRDTPIQREQEAHMRRLAEAQRNLHPRARLQSYDCGCRPCA